MADECAVTTLVSAQFHVPSLHSLSDTHRTSPHHHQVAKVPPPTPNKVLLSPCMGLSLRSSSYCFNYLFCKGVHWLRSISKVSCYTPDGFSTQNALTALLARWFSSLTPVLRAQKNSLAQVASPILRRHDSFLEFKAVIQATVQAPGKFPAVWDQASHPATCVSHSEWEGEIICSTKAVD